MYECRCVYYVYVCVRAERSRSRRASSAPLNPHKSSGVCVTTTQGENVSIFRWGRRRRRHCHRRHRRRGHDNVVWREGMYKNVLAGGRVTWWCAQRNVTGAAATLSSPLSLHHVPRSKQSVASPTTVTHLSGKCRRTDDCNVSAQGQFDGGG